MGGGFLNEKNAAEALCISSSQRKLSALKDSDMNESFVRTHYINQSLF